MAAAAVAIPHGITSIADLTMATVAGDEQRVLTLRGSPKVSSTKSKSYHEDLTANTPSSKPTARAASVAPTTRLTFTTNRKRFYL